VKTVARGRVYGADLGRGEKPWLVISENARNRVLDSVLAIRVTTTKLDHVASAVKLASADHPLVGWIRTDDLEKLFVDEIGREWGAVSTPTMRQVDLALHKALGMRWCPPRGSTPQ
jgi:mRNA interferase MazF